jgi:hypothetical protein
MIVNGTHVRLDNGRIGVVTHPQGSPVFDHWQIHGNPNAIVYAVLDEETGEIRHFTEAAVKKMMIN